MPSSICGQMASFIVTVVILLLLSISGFCASLSAARINRLPGFDGILPFHLETGYVTVDEERGAELFYYFVESERNPTEDPLILWLVGGTYCSGFIGFAMGMGPVNFKTKHYNGTLPTLIYNPFTWTKWLLDHPSFLSNPFYVAGDSYGGKMAPLVALEIVGGNEGFQLPLVNLKGYFVGNPVTGERIDVNSQAPHAHGLGIISDELLELLETNCEGEDFRNTKNALCAANLRVFNEGTVEEWQRCRSDLNNYTYSIASTVPHHLILLSRGYRALIYSGDHDLDIPFIGTLDWVKSLNFSILEDWHSWRAGGQVAGYTVLFSNNLTFATVKGGSHSPTDNMPRQSFSMFERWISHELLC